MDELVNSLRICGKIRSADDYCVAFHDGCCEAEPVCMYELMMKAADAIDELQKRVPKKPHGRLIDGDVAEVIHFTNEDADGKDFYDGILFAADFISQQPTIIEAEEGGDMKCVYANWHDGNPPCCTHECDGCVWSDDEKADEG